MYFRHQLNQTGIILPETAESVVDIEIDILGLYSG